DEEEWWKDIDLSFLLKGKEGIVNQFIEFVRPPVREFGDDVKHKVSIRLPEHVKHKLSEKIGFFSKNRDREVTDRGIHLNHLREGRFGQLLNKFATKEEDFISKTFDKMFHRLPEKIIEFLEPRVKEFEEKLLELLHVELRENIFKEDKFKGTIKAILSGDMNRDGKNDFMQAIESLFHHKHK
ncbi:13669_t:CDS:1, partial [Racocetra persica]